MSVKEQFFRQLIAAFADQHHGFTAAQCLTLLPVKRNVISHYLNRLCEDGLLSKDNGRPVRFYFSSAPAENAQESEDLHALTTLCRAAIDYPPDGLALLLTGESGTGKSHLAARLHAYAQRQGLIAADRPLVELNCADYANNPELLSSQLFGHSKGAFTGAAGEKEGLLDRADGGMLLLDEVHRLAAENQEKLFLFMDKGYFYRLGDNKRPHAAKVRFIFATTEEVDNVLLHTLRRRIPVSIHLPAWHERTRRERIALLETFLRQEAQQLDCDIRLDDDVFYGWLDGRFAGNIGEVRNQIKVQCATAWSRRRDGLLRLGSLPRPGAMEADGWLIRRDDGHRELPREDPCAEPLAEFCASRDAARLLGEMQARLDAGEDDGDTRQLRWQMTQTAFDRLSQRWGVTLSPALRLALYAVLRLALRKPTSDLPRFPAPALCPGPARARLMAREMMEALAGCGELQAPELFFSLAVALFALDIPPQAEIQGLIVTHGQSTASSIAALVNQLTGGYHFTAFDMPWQTHTRTIVGMLIAHLSQLRSDSGVLILVDMGSLQEIWHGIHQHVRGDLVVVNNVTTLLALEMAEKIRQGLGMAEIIAGIPGRYENEVRYYAGAPARNKIIVACISGEGIARKLQDILSDALDAAGVDVITMEYDALRQALQNKNALADARLIITTTELETGAIPALTIRQIIQGDADSLLQDYFAAWLNEAEFSRMIQQMVALFTVEGISSRLAFLNPDVVVEDIEAIIRRYERDYRRRFENYLHINLVMHIALMIERLMLNNGHSHRDDEPLDDAQRAFIARHGRYFQPLTDKYRIAIPQTELLMIGEILADAIVLDTSAR